MKQIFYSQLIGKKAQVCADQLIGESYAVFDQGVHKWMLTPVTAGNALSQGAILEAEEHAAEASQLLFPDGEIEMPMTESVVRAIVRQEVALWQNGIRAGSIPRFNPPPPEPTIPSSEDQATIDMLFGAPSTTFPTTTTP